MAGVLFGSVKKKMPNRRKRLTRRQIAAKEAQRQKGTGAFVEPSGNIVYRNPGAAPIMEAGPHSKIAFSGANVEWVKTAKKINETGLSQIFAGAMKVNGLGKPVKVVVKKINTAVKQKFMAQVAKNFRVKAFNYTEVISRLRTSEAVHPKTIYFVVGDKEFLVQEAFLRRGAESKFFPSNVFFIGMARGLATGEKHGKERLAKVAAETAKLAKSGLAYIYAWAGRQNPHPIIDVFNSIALKGGHEQVFVQDIDLVYVARNPLAAWKESSGRLAEVLEYLLRGQPQRVVEAKKIIAAEGKKNGIDWMEEVMRGQGLIPYA